MSPLIVLRCGVLYLPLAAALLLWALRPPAPRVRTGILVASAYGFVSLALLNQVALQAGGWTFGARGGTLAGIPVDLLLGWTVLWCVLPALAAPRAPLGLVALLALALDLFAMPRLAPLIVLGKLWWLGEGPALLAVLLPALLAVRWTVEDRRLAGRATLQALAFGGTLLYLAPQALLDRVGGSWSTVWERGAWGDGLGFQLALAPGLLGIAALQEFVTRGRGTPLPFDPPRRLVTSGPYAYLANPMQTSAALLTLSWAVLTGLPWLSLGTVASVAYHAFARWDEERDLAARFGVPWEAYHRAVRCWWPRWRPWHPALGDPSLPSARLYFAAGCDACSELGRLVARGRPIGLQLIPAELHPSRDLRRLTYDPGDGGPEAEGVEALARALDHLHLGWAVLGWIVRLPLVVSLAQVVADGVGGEPRLVRRRAV